jgi:hypothetical protein
VHEKCQFDFYSTPFVAGSFICGRDIHLALRGVRWLLRSLAAASWSLLVPLCPSVTVQQQYQPRRWSGSFAGVLNNTARLVTLQLALALAPLPATPPGQAISFIFPLESCSPSISISSPSGTVVVSLTLYAGISTPPPPPVRYPHQRTFLPFHQAQHQPTTSRILDPPTLRRRSQDDIRSWQLSGEPHAQSRLPLRTG